MRSVLGKSTRWPTAREIVAKIFSIATIRAALTTNRTQMLVEVKGKSTFGSCCAPQFSFLPCEPTQRDRPPKGDTWLHEVKFDGYRMQVHRAGRRVTIFTRNGHDWTDRFPRLAAELAALPSCIIDAELVATDAHGIADFARLQRIVSKRQEDGLALLGVRSSLCERARHPQHALRRAQDEARRPGSTCKHRGVAPLGVLRGWRAAPRRVRRRGWKASSRSCATAPIAPESRQAGSRSNARRGARLIGSVTSCSSVDNSLARGVSKIGRIAYRPPVCRQQLRGARDERHRKVHTTPKEKPAARPAYLVVHQLGGLLSALDGARRASQGVEQCCRRERFRNEWSVAMPFREPGLGGKSSPPASTSGPLWPSPQGGRGSLPVAV